MLIPIYEDEVDDFDECTYVIIGYDNDGDDTCYVTENDTITSVVERITQRDIDELLEVGLISVYFNGTRYDLEDVLNANLNTFIGQEITIECN